MRARRLECLASWLLAAWLVVLAAVTGPHLVHHVFDDDSAANCDFLATAHHAPGHIAAPPVVPSPALSAERLPRALLDTPFVAPRLLPSTRAPPASPSALAR